MTEGNPATGHPHGGRDESPDDSALPGERPLSEDEQGQDAPTDRGRDDETSSRAPEEGTMTSDQSGLTEPTPGVPEQVDAPSPADATDEDPPGGSVANQRGRVPDQ
jgi:hypothetical protein